MGPKGAKKGRLPACFVEDKLTDIYGITMKKIVQPNGGGSLSNIVADYGSVSYST
jgi:hypothetical protein